MYKDAKALAQIREFQDEVKSIKYQLEQIEAILEKGENKKIEAIEKSIPYVKTRIEILIDDYLKQFIAPVDRIKNRIDLIEAEIKFLKNVEK